MLVFWLQANAGRKLTCTRDSAMHVNSRTQFSESEYERALRASGPQRVVIYPCVQNRKTSSDFCLVFWHTSYLFHNRTGQNEHLETRPPPLPSPVPLKKWNTICVCFSAIPITHPNNLTRSDDQKRWKQLQREGNCRTWSNHPCIGPHFRTDSSDTVI